MFDDRTDAGQRLGKALTKYKGFGALVLAIPRGGVEVGYYVAEQLRVPLSIVIVRKLPLPKNPEAGFGAIAEDGSTFFVDRACNRLSSEVIAEILEEQKRELKRRIDVLRGGKPLPEINGRTVILVDDGIAMGSTIQAAIRLCKNKQAKKIVVAAPVASPVTATELAKVVDEVVILEEPLFFRAVAEVYRNWYDVSDDEVIHILQKAENLLPAIKAGYQ
jgi:putative phosphoribosyl transferase